MFSITFSINNSEIYRVYKSLTTITTLTGTLKSATSILTPTIIIEIPENETLNAISRANYAYIEMFNNRKYFITDMRLLHNNLIEIDMKCDVLSTYAEEIISQTAIIKKQENEWNLYLNDGTFKTFQNPLILTRKFPTGFSDSTYILSIAGR